MTITAVVFLSATLSFEDEDLALTLAGRLFVGQRPAGARIDFRTDKRMEVNNMIPEDIFEGDIVLDVPCAAAEYGRKMPGHQDSNGDHCTD